MKKSITLLQLIFCLLLSADGFSQNTTSFSDDIAVRLSELPIKCINQEYPNKTGHVINNETDVTLSPQGLHPVFYGCFDWHSSVHGHWMLVRLLKIKPSMSNREQIIALLNLSFDSTKLFEESRYFEKYAAAETYERTYGWAWLLKLDEELSTWNNLLARQWHANLQSLTRKIVALWKKYLPKQTYPNRTGVHPNSAFALAFAIDWARATNDTEFEAQLLKKAIDFYADDSKTPAYLEPDGSDFFSPSLEIADLMHRVLAPKEYAKWLRKFYDNKSIENICQVPEVSDINDYQIVHLIGLSFSKAWCMKNIAKSLPKNNVMAKRFGAASEEMMNNALPYVFNGNYGGEHWLASFAVMALE
ncbi:MAG: DUF2891 domain-containing protein [Paludibacteraceae bacterium]